jgi:hypothetical protein
MRKSSSCCVVLTFTLLCTFYYYYSFPRLHLYAGGERRGCSGRTSDGTLTVLRFFVVFFSPSRQLSPFHSTLYSLATDSFTKQSINPETSSLYLCYLPNPAIYFPSLISFILSSLSFYSFSTFLFSVSLVPLCAHL